MERKNELPSANREGNEQSLTASGVVSFVESHQGLILAVLGGIVAVVALYFVLNQYVWGPREDAAKNEIFKAQQMFARDSFQVALDGNDEFMGFLDIIDEYGSTSTGNLAYAYAGICYKNLGEYDEAIKCLNKFSGSDELVSPAIIGSIGDCYWDMDNASKAVDYYMKAAAKADNDLLSPLYKKRAALAYLSMDKKSEAVKLLEGIVTEYPNYADMTEVMKFLEIAKQN